MQSFVSVSQLARQFDIPPRKISDLFYARVLDDAACPIIERVRMIPKSYVPEIERVLRERGILREAVGT